MKKLFKFTLVTAFMIAAGTYAYGLAAETAVFCTQGTGGTCVQRSDSQGFNCDPVSSGGDCSGTYIKEIGVIQD